MHYFYFFFMPQFEVKVSDLISPRVAVILVMKNKFFRCDFTQNWKKLSKCNQCYQTKKSQGTNKKKNLEKKVFLWQFLRKNEKINENYPMSTYLKNRLFSTSCKNHRYPAGYPATSGRISGIRPPPDIRIRHFICRIIRYPAQNPYPAQP